MPRIPRKLAAATGIIVCGAFVWYCVHVLRGHNLSAYANMRAASGLLLMVAFYLTNLPLDGLAWRHLLRGVGVDASWRETTAIVGITQFAKYIPGNVAQYFGRAALSLPRGIHARAFAVSTVFELVLTSSAALAVGLAAGSFSVYARAIEHDESTRLVVLGGLLAAIVAGLFVLHRLAPSLARRFAPRHAGKLDGSQMPAPREILIAFLLYALAFAMIGLGFARMAHLALPIHIHHDWLLGASFAIAWIVGFLAPGAPAGLGVREALLVLMLSPAFTPSLAVFLVIALRIATTLGDAIMLGIGYLLLPQRKPVSGC